MANPIITHTYTCDPTALVYEGTVYLITGHDEAPVGVQEYVMNKWLCFSSADMINWREHNSPFAAKDFRWAKGDAYAGNLIERSGLFYFYAPVTPIHGKGKAIGVAVADHPAGPYRDAKGSALITFDMLPRAVDEKANLDPTVIIDDDGLAYIFWGNQQCYYARLKNNMVEIDGEITVIDLPGFEEGAHIFKRNGWYYFAYGYGYPEKVAYAMCRNVHGPWEFKGILNEIAGNCATNRPCVIDFKNNSYFIYHNGALREGGSHRRSVCIDHLHYRADDSIQRVIMTSEGISPVALR